LNTAVALDSEAVVMEVDDQQVRVSGDTAVVSGRVMFYECGQSEVGQQARGPLHAGVGRQGVSWHLVAEQLTLIAAS
jgi:hypothetical protein